MSPIHGDAATGTHDSYDDVNGDDSYLASDGHEDIDDVQAYPLIKPYHDADYYVHQIKNNDNDSPEDSRRDANEFKVDDNEAMIGHGEFFDADGDGIFSPIDTFRGFRALGYSLVISLFSSMVICTMSYSSLPAGHWLPDPFFRIYVDGLHKAKHGSDSGSFKRDGRFDEKRFEKFWSSHTDAPHEEITPIQLYHAVAQRRLAYDFYGMFAAIFEWFATWLLFGYPSFRFNSKLVLDEIFGLFGTNGKAGTKGDDATKDAKEWVIDTLKAACSGGNVKKQDVVGLYDGTIFYTVMDRQADAGNEWAKAWRRKHERAHANKKLKTTVS
ncbi:Caleosin related protein-domain-containing protein [Lentinula edodes]|nr:Caleosin related protein-domain-containing protein [Lentinula edodes]